MRNHLAALAGGLGLLLAASLPGIAQAETHLLKESRLEMGLLPESESSPWIRLGEGAAFLLDDALFVNDNSNVDHIAYQSVLGEDTAEHRVTFAARVKVLSNLGGEASTMEIARPGLQVVLRLHKDRVELLERRDRRRARWLGTVAVDLTDYREVVLQKASVHEHPAEIISVLVDGALVLQAEPVGDGTFPAARLLLGSLSSRDMGASFWDWVSYRVESVDPNVPAARATFGRFKSRF